MSRRGRANRCRPQLECLEGRDVPAAGVLDPTFGDGGLAVYGFSNDDQGNASALQPDGKVVLAGRVYGGDAGTDFGLARYNHDGSLDTSFGTGGRVSTDFGEREVAAAVAVQPDGKIVAAGSTSFVVFHFALARYNHDGSLDTTFGVGGRVVTDFGGGTEFVVEVAVLPDGKILAVG